MASTDHRTTAATDALLMGKRNQTQRLTMVQVPPAQQLQAELDALLSRMKSMTTLAQTPKAVPAAPEFAWDIAVDFDSALVAEEAATAAEALMNTSMEQQREKAAVRIQCWTRCILSGRAVESKWRQLIHAEMEAAAILVQASFRASQGRQKAMKQLEMVFEAEAFRAALMVQCSWRQKVARRKVEMARAQKLQ